MSDLGKLPCVNQTHKIPKFTKMSIALLTSGTNCRGDQTLNYSIQTSFFISEENLLRGWNYNIKAPWWVWSPSLACLAGFESWMASGNWGLAMLQPWGYSSNLGEQGWVHAHQHPFWLTFPFETHQWSSINRAPSRSTLCLTRRLESLKCFSMCSVLSTELIKSSKHWSQKERAGNEFSSQPAPTGITKNEMKSLFGDLGKKDRTVVGLWLREESCLLLEPRQTC